MLFRAHIEFIRSEHSFDPVPLLPIPESAAIKLVRHDFDQTIVEIDAPDITTAGRILTKHINPAIPVLEHNLLQLYVLV